MAMTPAGLAVDRRRRSRWRRRRAARPPRSASASRSTPCLPRNAALPSSDALALDGAEHALAGRRVEVGDPGAARACAARAAATMAAASGCSLARSTLAASRSSRLVEACRRHDRGDRRPAFGQRAGLVDDQRVDLLQPLQRLGVLDQHAGLGAAADADHDRHRRGEAERAGAGDDQHGDRGDQRVGEARLRAPDRPRRAKATTATTMTAGTNQPDTGRPAAGSARGCAAPRRPSARSAPASCRAPTLLGLA